MVKTDADVIVIGAGAAGLICAIECGRRQRSVLVLDHSSRIGNKVRVAGGGRCNFTNLGTRPENYLSQNPHFCKSALSRFSPRDFLHLLEKYRVGYHEEDNGRLFCDRGSGEIIRMLRQECGNASATFSLGSRVLGVVKKDGFEVTTNRGIFRSHSLVVATGGISFPQLGATGLGHRIAAGFGIKVTPLRPGLAPLLWNARDRALFGELSGISLKGAISTGPVRFEGDILFTHRGLSGPAALQISLYWSAGDRLVVDLLPDVDVGELFLSKRSGRVEMINLLSGLLPKRFVRLWCRQYSASKPLNSYSVRELENVAHDLHHWRVEPEGTGGYREAEVTLGGVDTRELSSRTMEAKKIPGLFFIGEVLDITGQLGGYNLQWAWSSGHAAGQAA